MKKFALFLLAFAFTSLQAQVGINTTDPKAQLEIKATNQATPDATDGILIPKVDTFPAINPTSDQDGMMVYLTTDIGANLKGFYYWDNTNAVWKSISGDKGWGLAGNAGTDVTTNFIGTTDNQDLVFKRNNVKSGLVSYDNTSFGNNTLSTDTLVFGFYAGKGNTAFGGYTLSANTTGYGNVAFGENSLAYNTIGTNNSSVGNNALSSNTTGNANCAFGYLSLALNESGSNNTSSGFRTLQNNISNNNTAVGCLSMYENTSGSDNVAIGVSSLQNNKTGNNNVAIGSGALMNNSASNNVAVGKSALFSNTTGIYNSAFGNEALFNSVSGTGNSAFGNQSLYNDTTGFFNTAIGHKSLFENTTGSSNTASGVFALLKNVNGSSNAAYGYSAMNYNIGGNQNCAFGAFSLYYNTTGNKNSAFGLESMVGNLTGSNNSAFGSQSMTLLSSGNGNAAFGNRSLFRINSGEGNVAFGLEANPTASLGWNNIGIGFHSLGNIDSFGNRILGNVVGYDNIGLGLFAGDRIGFGCDQSVFIGPFTNVITNGNNVSNATAIGNGALVFQNNMMRLGNSAVTRIETQVGLTVVSDGRYKFNVKEEVKGLDFIKKLRPVVYQYDTEKMDREWMNVEFDTMAKHNPQILKDYKKASQIRYSGFIAQEVETAAKAINYEFSGISKPENDEGHYGLDYASFVVPLVKSIQEQQKEIEDLEKQLASEKSKNIQIEKRLKAIEQKLSNL